MSVCRTWKPHGIEKQFMSMQAAIPKEDSADQSVKQQQLQTKLERICRAINTALKRSPKSSTVRWTREDLVELLLKCKVPEEQMINLLPNATTSLTCAPLCYWKDTIAFLKDNQFYPNQILPVVVGFPELLNNDSSASARKSFNDTFAWLRSCGVGEGKMQATVSRNPSILYCKLSALKQRHADLLEVV